jgi:hypothetical protein
VERHLEDLEVVTRLGLLDLSEFLRAVVPVKATLHYALSQVYLERGEVERALQHLEVAASLLPDAYRDVYVLTRASVVLPRDVSEALCILEKAGFRLD